MTHQLRRNAAYLAALVAFVSSPAFAQSTPPAPTAKPVATPAATPAATAPAATAAKTPAAKPTAVPRSGDAQYEARLRQIEERVVGIKERIFQTKTRLLLLKEQILDDVVAESRAVLLHQNQMGSFFELRTVLYYLDGKKIYYQDNSNGLLQKRREFEIYNGSIIPGNHSLTVELVYRGSSDLFSYLKGYVFKLRSAYTFYAAKGRITRVSVIGYERGGIGTDLEDKPYIKYEVRQTQNRAKIKTASKKTK
ncbi:MAG: dihydrolipoamide acetyltransferase [Myxococcales bacterium]|nr:dihydrolipoamide acetyltransferase [Myxococcales bacterium]